MRGSLNAERAHGLCGLDVRVDVSGHMRSTTATARDLLDVFVYTSPEQEAFPYLRLYTEKLLANFEALAARQECHERIALAGLFLTYRASNHNGTPLDTRYPSDWACTEHADRLAAYAQITGEHVTSVAEYLSKIGLSPRVFFRMTLIAFIRPRYFGACLYRFVDDGRL